MEAAEVTGDSAEAMLSPHPLVGLMAVAVMAAVALFTVAVRTTAAGDIMAPVLASVSAFMRPTAMPLQFVIPADSMMQTACGNIIRVAPFRTDIKTRRRISRLSAPQPKEIRGDWNRYEALGVVRSSAGDLRSGGGR
jgi:hypothetical protein